MPTTDPFTALGGANGFPFCPIRRDVSALNFWITLGGYKKPDADSSIAVTESQIYTSLVNAMRLWWNSYSINVAASAQRSLEYSDASNYPDSDTQSAGVSITSPDSGIYGIVQLNQTTGPAVEPVERVCGVSNGTIQADGSDTDGPAGSIEARASFLSRIEIVRMYNGSTSNEDNFIGYGFERSNTAQGFLRIDAEAAGSPSSTSSSKYEPEIHIQLKSYPNQFTTENDPTQTGTTFPPDSSGGVEEIKYDRGYGQKDGFYFFVFVEARAGGTDHQINIDISGCQADATSEFFEEFGPGNIYYYDYIADASAEFVSVTDYTY